MASSAETISPGEISFTPLIFSRMILVWLELDAPLSFASILAIALPYGDINWSLDPIPHSRTMLEWRRGKRGDEEESQSATVHFECRGWEEQRVGKDCVRTLNSLVAQCEYNNT